MEFWYAQAVVGVGVGLTITWLCIATRRRVREKLAKVKKWWEERVTVVEITSIAIINWFLFFAWMVKVYVTPEFELWQIITATIFLIFFVCLSTSQAIRIIRRRGKEID